MLTLTKDAFKVASSRCMMDFCCDKNNVSIALVFIEHLLALMLIDFSVKFADKVISTLLSEVRQPSTYLLYRHT